MQMAWDEAAKHFGGTLPLKGTPAMGSALDDHLVSAADLDPSSYVALAGFRRDGIVDKIPQAIIQKFGASHSPQILPSNAGSPDDLIAYAYLSKILKFEPPFLSHDNRALSFEGETSVRSFGIEPSDDVSNAAEIIAHVQIFNYVETGDCIIELKTTSDTDRLILAMVKSGATLKDTIDAVLPQIQGPGMPMLSRDYFRAPAMDFDVLRVYGEVLHLPILNPCIDTQDSVKEYQLIDARQTVEFRLDEHGVVLKSEAAQ